MVLENINVRRNKPTRGSRRLVTFFHKLQRITSYTAVSGGWIISSAKTNNFSRPMLWHWSEGLSRGIIRKQALCLIDSRVCCNFTFIISHFISNGYNFGETIHRVYSQRHPVFHVLRLSVYFRVNLIPNMIMVIFCTVWRAQIYPIFRSWRFFTSVYGLAFGWNNLAVKYYM